MKKRFTEEQIINVLNEVKASFKLNFTYRLIIDPDEYI